MPFLLAVVAYIHRKVLVSQLGMACGYLQAQPFEVIKITAIDVEQSFSHAAAKAQIALTGLDVCLIWCVPVFPLMKPNLTKGCCSRFYS